MYPRAVAISTHWRLADFAHGIFVLISEGTVKDEIISLVKKEIKPEQPQTKYVTQQFGRKLEYDVMLVESQGEDRFAITPAKFGPKIVFRWRGELISGFFNDETLVEDLTPSTFYVLVGTYKIRNWNGRDWNNINVHGLISMDEIAAYNKSEKAQSEEIDAKIDSHKGPEVVEDVTPEPTE